MHAWNECLAQEGRYKMAADVHICKYEDQTCDPFVGLFFFHLVVVRVTADSRGWGDLEHKRHRAPAPHVPCDRPSGGECLPRLGEVRESPTSLLNQTETGKGERRWRRNEGEEKAAGLMSEAVWMIEGVLDLENAETVQYLIQVLYYCTFTPLDLSDSYSY